MLLILFQIYLSCFVFSLLVCLVNCFLTFAISFVISFLSECFIGKLAFLLTCSTSWSTCEVLFACLRCILFQIMFFSWMDSINCVFILSSHAEITIYHFPILILFFLNNISLILSTWKLGLKEFFQPPLELGMVMRLCSGHHN